MRIAHVLVTVGMVAALTQTGGAVAAPRTHDACDANAALEQTCQAVVQDGLRYTCFGTNAVEPLLQTTPLPSGYTLYTWTIKVTGYHECPDRLGDWMRVTGWLEYTFGGAPGQPSGCGGFQWCTNETFGWWQSVVPDALITVTTTTSSTDAPSGTAIDSDQYLF